MIQVDVEEERQEILKRYRRLLRQAKPVLKSGDTKLIKKAFTISLEAHKDMRRKSGEPYIYHPLEVALICVEEIGLGTTSIISALLHDVVEDTDLELEDIERDFGTKVMTIIDGLTKISGVFDYGSSQQAENFRKMLLTLSDDVRVILIKLADRLNNMRSFFSVFFCSIFCSMSGQILQPYENSLNPGIIPAPQHIELSPRGGYFTVNKKYSQYLEILEYKIYHGFEDFSIGGQFSGLINPNLPAEGYTLKITKKEIQVLYSDAQGLRYAIQTLEQVRNLSPNNKIPCMTITDFPRFRYRGIHLDVSRHYFDSGFLYKYAAMAAQYRFNMIHLHLTDDQGWRLESKRYPKLNTISSTRSGTQTGPYSLQHFDTFAYRGNYSQEFLQEYVAWCQHFYGITVIPEIEMPGHALAALAAYPELSCTGGPFETAKGWGVFDDGVAQRVDIGIVARAAVQRVGA